MYNWYEISRKEIEKLYSDDAELFIDILAATSPRKRVKENWRLSQQIYESYLAGDINLKGCMPAHKGNVSRAIAREPLQGRKVRAFAEALKGNMDVVVVDIWIGRWFGFETITNKTYDFIENAIRMMAAACGRKPAELQAELWCDMIREYGQHPVSYADVVDKQLYLW